MFENPMDDDMIDNVAMLAEIFETLGYDFPTWKILFIQEIFIFSGRFF